MMEWKDIDPIVLEEMEKFGRFEPTSNANERSVVGWLNNQTTYFESIDLYRMAYAFLAVAEWLDQRAIEYDMNGENT